MGVPTEPVPEPAAVPVLGIVIGSEFAGSLIETMKMASAVLTESVDEHTLPAYDQVWLADLAAALDRSASLLDFEALSRGPMSADAADPAVLPAQ